MKKVTRNNLIRLVYMKKNYQKTGNQEMLEKINNFTENVINKDKRYYHKLKSYDLPSEMLAYLV